MTAVLTEKQFEAATLATESFNFLNHQAGFIVLCWLVFMAGCVLVALRTDAPARVYIVPAVLATVLMIVSLVMGTSIAVDNLESELGELGYQHVLWEDGESHERFVGSHEGQYVSCAILETNHINEYKVACAQ